MSQTELAVRADCSVATISRLEEGSNVTLQTLETVAGVLGTDAITLQVRGPSDEDDISPLWARADTKARKQILSIAKTIIDES